jgi:hypothetical protein
MVSLSVRRGLGRWQSGALCLVARPASRPFRRRVAHRRPRFRGADRRKTDRAPVIAAGIRRGGQRLALRPNQPSQASSRPTAGVPCARNAMPVTGAPNCGDDAAELGSFPYILIDEEGLGNGGRVGECRSIRTAWNLSLRLSRLPMIRMRSPARCSRCSRCSYRRLPRRHWRRVDAELVDDYSVSPAVGLAEHPVEQRRFARGDSRLGRSSGFGWSRGSASSCS